jgi:hypothetical protein
MSTGGRGSSLSIASKTFHHEVDDGREEDQEAGHIAQRPEPDQPTGLRPGRGDLLEEAVPPLDVRVVLEAPDVIDHLGALPVTALHRHDGHPLPRAIGTDYTP